MIKHSTGKWGESVIDTEREIYLVYGKFDRKNKTYSVEVVKALHGDLDWVVGKPIISVLEGKLCKSEECVWCNGVKMRVESRTGFKFRGYIVDV